MERKPYKRQKTYRKKKPVKKKDPVKVDTIRWNDEIIKLPPTEDDLKKKYNSVQKQVYKIGLILPLKSGILMNDLSQLRKHYSYRFVNYYGGVIMALEDLEKEGVSFEIQLINSKIKNNDASRLFNKLEDFDPDVIIGPYERKLLKSVAHYGKKNDISVVSPWQSSSKIARNNPNYVQLKPDIKTFFESIVTHVDKHFLPEQTYLLGRKNKSEVSRLNYLQEVHLSANTEGVERQAYHKYYVEQDSLDNGVTAFDTLFTGAFNEIAVVLPNWSFKDEQFIYSCVRKLNAEKQNTRVYLYGMPILLESDKIGFNLYENLNMRVALSQYVNKDQWDVKEFMKRYYLRYNAIPADDALEAYDMMMYIGRNLHEYGTKFQYFLTENYQEFLQTGFNMAPVGAEEDVLEEKLDEADYFENKHIDIREFRYNGFERID